MSSYEENCRDYALHGNPMRDAMDYEDNARYDRFDGHRSLCTAGYDDPNCGDMAGEPAEATASEPEPEVPFDDNIPF
jgi:hypothetical protein